MLPVYFRKIAEEQTDDWKKRNYIGKAKVSSLFIPPSPLELKQSHAKFHEECPIETRQASHGLQDGYYVLYLWMRAVSLPAYDAAHQKVRVFTLAQKIRVLIADLLGRPCWDTSQTFSCEHCFLSCAESYRACANSLEAGKLALGLHESNEEGTDVSSLTVRLPKLIRLKAIDFNDYNRQPPVIPFGIIRKSQLLTGIPGHKPYPFRDDFDCSKWIMFEVRCTPKFVIILLLISNVVVTSAASGIGPCYHSSPGMFLWV